MSTSATDRVHALLQRYFTRCRELREAGAPVKGLTVRIHPEDAREIQRSYRELSVDSFLPPGGDFMFPAHVYGAEWFEDASVPVGDIRIEVTRG